jgi:hypothetical protein
MEVLCLLQFPIDLEQYDRREQLKKSGLGKVYLYQSLRYIILQKIICYALNLSIGAYLGHYVFVQI